MSYPSPLWVFGVPERPPMKQFGPCTPMSLAIMQVHADLNYAREEHIRSVPGFSLDLARLNILSLPL